MASRVSVCAAVHDTLAVPAASLMIAPVPVIVTVPTVILPTGVKPVQEKFYPSSWTYIEIAKTSPLQMTLGGIGVTSVRLAIRYT